MYSCNILSQSKNFRDWIDDILSQSKNFRDWIDDRLESTNSKNDNNLSDYYHYDGLCSVC